MKKFLLTNCLLLAGLQLFAGGIREERNFEGEKAGTSYALGMIIGSEFSSSGLELDYPAFLSGLKASMENEETKFTQEEAIEKVQNAFQTAMIQRAEENRLKEELFLSMNGEREEVYVTSSGLQYEILTEAEGEKPGSEDFVQVHYEGMLTDGTIFDSSYSRGEPVEFPLSGVIQGWTEGIQLMSVGSKYRFYIPSAMAYGERGAGQIIPPYSTLIFTVELLDIVKYDTEQDDYEAETDDFSAEVDAGVDVE